MTMLGDDAAITFIKSYPFATLISEELEATHIPLVARFDNNQTVLYGHFAKANLHWQSVENKKVLAIFHGPHAYISPTWYKTKPAVPTWNYAAVHCTGKASLLTLEQTIECLDDLLSTFEPSLHTDKQIVSDEYKYRLAQAVVGFKVVVDDIQAKEKLGQHKSIEDQIGVFSSLRKSENIDAKTLAQYMQKRKVGIGEN